MLILQTWIVGKWITPREQSWAPSGTHFHQFVVPPILHFRRDCTYGDLAAMRVPADVEGLGYCEVTNESPTYHSIISNNIYMVYKKCTHHILNHLLNKTIWVRVSYITYTCQWPYSLMACSFSLLLGASGFFVLVISNYSCMFL